LETLHLFAAECQQLAGQFCSLARGPQNLLQIAAKWVFGTCRMKRQFGVRADHHQEIVKIVRDPAS